MSLLAGKLAVVTGASAGIGKEIAWGLFKLGADVIMPVRNVAKGNAVREELAARATKQGLRGVGSLAVSELELSKQSSIAKFVADFKSTHKKLHILVNNAAVVPETREETEDGLEFSFATNVMGYFLLSRGLLESLEADGTPARIVNVASLYAGGLKVDDLNFEHSKYDSNAGYKQTKQANRMLSWALHNRLQQRKSLVTVNVCHPGIITTQLLDDLGFGTGDSTEKGASTPVFLASEPSLEKVSGKFWDNKKETNCTWKNADKANEQLWEKCESYIKVSI